MGCDLHMSGWEELYQSRTPIKPSCIGGFRADWYFRCVAIVEAAAWAGRRVVHQQTQQTTEGDGTSHIRAPFNRGEPMVGLHLFKLSRSNPVADAVATALANARRSP